MSYRGQKLILVRHSLPKMVTGVSASRWLLSAEGLRRCEPLARQLAAYDLEAIVASEEAKAVETGRIVAFRLGLTLETAPDLHEHKRGVVQALGSRAEFEAQVGVFFAHPGDLVLGGETADQAHARFSAAVARVVERRAAGRLAIVSHGTVMTLLIARANGLDPFSFWRSLGLPSYAVLSFPDLELDEVVGQVG